jgi:small-conductance mechanosensitive channel
MGGVRGDVIALRFTQTVIMEMGQPPGEQSDAPSMWVRGRQYTGRIVSVTNAKIFDEAIYNYTREFPFVWDEMSIPVSFTDDAATAERILLEAARKHSLDAQSLGEQALAEMERQYAMRREDAHPHVFWRITDNWLELSVRFLVADHGVRAVKDKMSREILAGLNEAGIGIASTTIQLVGTSKLEIVNK